MQLTELIRAGLASIRSPNVKIETDFYPQDGTYHNTSVYRGFPLGTIGSGGFGLDTAGGFIDLRMNNNWMNPVRHAKGAFWAAACSQSGERRVRILRRRFSGGREYGNILPVRDVYFSGNIPQFQMRFAGDWPLDIQVSGFSPLVPHSVRDSSIPAAVFRVGLSNTSSGPLEAAFVFSWENVLGCGGTGQTGVILSKGSLAGLPGRLTYDDRRGNDQKRVRLDGLQGVSFFTRQEQPETSHRRSVLGRYLLLVDPHAGMSVSITPGWDAAERKPYLFEHLARHGRVPDSHLQPARRPAAAVCITCELEPGQTRAADFYLVWWTPDHVTELDVVARARSGEHAGLRVGHVYENHFQGPEEIAGYLAREHQRLQAESTALQDLYRESNLPSWLQRALVNSADSVITNTVLPKDGSLYTLEGCDWGWYFGGLTGTNDQRLSSHPFTATFFPSLDRSEVDSFRRLHRDGAVPHGNGNCDLALGTAGVPYGWPVKIRGALSAERWPDLTMSCILQTHRLYRTTGDRAWVEQAWPDLLAMLAALQAWSVDGIPEGGTTYDTLSFPGAFIYTAGLYLASLEALIDLASELDPERLEEIEILRRSAAARVDADLWNDEKGYYRATGSRDTLFIGALAGDWFARYAGLPPVLPPDQARMHLRLAHRMLLAGRSRRTGPAPFPFSEAYPNGRPVPARIMGIFPVPAYAWQVISYHALEAVYLGHVQAGLETIQVLYDRMWYGGYPWSADLYGNPGAVYMTHPVLWALPYALSGAALDVPRHTLRLAPQQLPGEQILKIPVCFPGFWALLEVDYDRGRVELSIRRHFGEPLQLERLVFEGIGGSGRELALDPPLILRAGENYRFFFGPR